MISYPKNLLAPIIKFLRREEQELKKRQKSLQQEDPFKDTERLNDNASDDTEASEQFGHQRSEALSKATEVALQRVRFAMERVEKGTYGQCTNCGKMIDTDRLGVDPTAELCITCAKKK